MLPAPRPEKKERDRKRDRQTKVGSAELEGFVDWKGILSSESVEEEEMFMLVAGFAARMRKRDVDSEDESTPYMMGRVQSDIR